MYRFHCPFCSLRWAFVGHQQSAFVITWRGTNRPSTTYLKVLCQRMTQGSGVAMLVPVANHHLGSWLGRKWSNQRRKDPRCSWKLREVGTYDIFDHTRLVTEKVPGCSNGLAHKPFYRSKVLCMEVQSGVGHELVVDPVP